MSNTPLVLRIGCWNVNSLRVRWPLVESWLKTERIDVALLQETKVIDTDFPQQTLKQAGYYSAFWGQKTYNGVAILSRWPLSDMVCLDLNGTGAARCIQVLTHGLRLCCVYIPQGQAFAMPAFQEKLTFLNGLYQHMAAYVHDFTPTIVGGDLNIALNDEDVWDTDLWRNQVMCSIPERNALRKILWTGWTMAQVRIKGHKNPPTWWNYQHRAWPKQHGLCIDSFMLSPSAADLFCDTSVSKQWRSAPQPSDHAPITLELRNPA